jgi:hypothetical protein
VVPLRVPGFPGFRVARFQVSGFQGFKVSGSQYSNGAKHYVKLAAVNLTWAGSAKNIRTLRVYLGIAAVDIVLCSSVA